MNEEEILFNKLHDIFKNNISNKSTRAIIESAEFINVNKEKISLEHTKIKEEFYFMGKLEGLIKICKKIQGEDIGAILGFDKYKSISKVYEEKTKEQNYLQRDVDAGYWINTLEEVVSREFMLRTKKKIRNYNVKSIDKDCEFMVSNVNRKIVGENSILGCYVLNGIDENDIKSELFSKKYMIQAQHDMKVKNADKSYIAMLINGEIFIMSEVKRDESLISKIVKAEEIFWKCHIENKVEPLKPLNLDKLD